MPKDILRKWEICDYCKGDGWTTEHDSTMSHGADGECLTCPVQERCDKCEGSGKVLTETPSKEDNINEGGIPF